VQLTSSAVVFTPELKLLELSIIKRGCLQPILITDKKVIIDGFHRHQLALTSQKVMSKDEQSFTLLLCIR
jgi:hypothetical protein